MMRLFKILFNGGKPVDVSSVVGAVRVEPQRQEIARQLREIDESYRKIGMEAKKMKKSIDTALAIAMATGGLK